MRFRNLARRLSAVAFILAVAALPCRAGGGWIDDPGHGTVRIGWDSKFQPDAQRRDENGELYRSAFDFTHRYRFLIAQADVGVGYGFELAATVSYLFAAETVNASSEDPSWHYHDFSDMWVGAKYQVLAGAIPVAVGVTVRLPYLYDSKSHMNGQLATNIPGLLNHDYEGDVYVSHGFDNGAWVSAQGGFKYREAAFAHQVTFGAEGGWRPPWWNGRMYGKIAVDGAFSVGAEGQYTSLDRFPSRYLDVIGHMFEYNSSDVIRPSIAAGLDITSDLSMNAGFTYTVWGHSIDVYSEWYAMAGWRF